MSHVNSERHESTLTQHERSLLSNRKFFAVCSLVIVALIFAIQISAPATVHAQERTGVVGDDNNDAYVGSGGLLLPSSFSGSGSTKRSVSSCMDCVWKYTIYCAADSEVMCGHAVTTCPAGMIRYRVWFGHSIDELSVVGSVCWGSSKPATRRDIEDRLEDLVVRNVPVLQLECDPPGDTLTAIPVVCFTGQPTAFRPAPFTLSGRTVHIAATPTWRWDWGDDVREWHAVPGKPYPSHQIDHQYRQLGLYSVSVKTVWNAKYSVSGLGTYQVAGDVVTQNDAMNIQVHSARAIRAVPK